jgi:ribosomal protein S6--L-glutamate ligase
MSRIGVVGLPNGWSSLRLVAAVERRGCQAVLVEMKHVAVDLDARTIRYHDEDLSRLDALIIKKIGRNYSPSFLDRLSSLGLLAGRCLPIFSDPLRIRAVVDRHSCTIALRGANIPMPPTLITEDVDLAADAVRRFGRAVLKPLYTSKARGMVVVEDGPNARTAVEQFHAAGNRTLYVQKLLKLPGRDLGLVFLGGEYVGCYARVARGLSWSTSTHQGGKYEPHDAEPSIVELARRAQEPFGLAFTSVDVAVTDAGPVVFEVSAFGGFRGLWEAREIDAAQLYADFVLSRIGRGR